MDGRLRNEETKEKSCLANKLCPLKLLELKAKLWNHAVVPPKSHDMVTLFLFWNDIYIEA